MQRTSSFAVEDTTFRRNLKRRFSYVLRSYKKIYDAIWLYECQGLPKKTTN
jgi:hypothetical protein